MTESHDLSSDWITYEVFQRDDQGEHTITPVSEALAVSGSVPAQAITKMRMVQELGWPVAKRVLTDDCGHPLIVKKTRLSGFSSASLVAGGSTFMFGKKEKKSALSMSTQSAKKLTPNARLTPSKLGASMAASGKVEVLSRSSSSPLAEIYRTEEFKNEWANDVRFHVARNLLHLRRYREMSQGAVGKAMGTSQSAIARIESAQENITLDTLRRLIVALSGRLHISILPQEYPSHQKRPWWEAIPSTTETPWSIVGFAGRRGNQTDQVLVGLERSHGLPIANTFALEASLLLAKEKTSD